MAFRIKGATVVNDNREATVNNVTATANDRVFVGVTATGTTPLSPSIFQGSVSGYASGGLVPPESNVIDKFPFASDTNATDVGDLTVSRRISAGQSSTTHGYTSGGYTNPPLVYFKVIDKFPFAVDTNATSSGNLTVNRTRIAGQSSTTHGYTSGGYDGPVVYTIIDKFPFSVDANATDVGDLTQKRQDHSSQSSATHGYNSGGFDPPGVSNTIDKFPFSSDTNATDVGDMTSGRRITSGQSSITHGYVSGGTTTAPALPGIVNTIDKFPFSSDTNATDIGDLIAVNFGSAGQSSTVSGYASGGYTPPSGNVNTIQKFPFASDTNASDVGDLTQARTSSAGQQARTLQ